MSDDGDEQRVFFIEHQRVQRRFDERFAEWLETNEALDANPVDPVELRNLMERSLELMAETNELLADLTHRRTEAFERWPGLLDQFVEHVTPELLDDVEGYLDEECSGGDSTP